MALGLVLNYIYIYNALSHLLGKLNVYNVNNVCFIILVEYQIWFEQTFLMFILVYIKTYYL
jgi:hypothetical protein